MIYIFSWKSTKIRSINFDEQNCYYPHNSNKNEKNNEERK